MFAHTDLFFWLACLCMGGAAAVLGLALREPSGTGLDFVERDLTDKLRRLRVSGKGVRRHIVTWLLVVGMIFVAFWLVADNLVFAVLVAVLLLSLPWYLLRRMAERRRQKIEDQMADAMVTLASAVKAGLSLAQSLEILAAQCPKPISTEFRQMIGEYNMGKPLERVLIEAKERLRSENFAIFAAALLAAHESGGRLNETVERIAASVLEMQRLERKIQSETAQARKSAVYMGLAPLFILAAYYFLDPENTRLLFTQTVGQILLAVALILNIVAYVWARMILTPDI
jgi:tight adherence protein B